MITRQEDPGALELGHGGQRLPDRPTLRVRAVEDIAGDEHSVGAVLTRQRRDAAHSVKTRPAQIRPWITRDTGERLAELPVGGVEQANGHGPADATTSFCAQQATAISLTPRPALGLTPGPATGPCP